MTATDDISRLEKRVDRLEDVVPGIDKRVTINETNISTIISTVERIGSRLERALWLVGGAVVLNYVIPGIKHAIDTIK